VFVVERLGVRYHKVVGVRRVKVVPKNNLPKAIGDTCSHNFMCVFKHDTKIHKTDINRHTNCETDKMNAEENSGEMSIFFTKTAFMKHLFFQHSTYFIKIGLIYCGTATVHKTFIFYGIIV